MLYVSHRIVGIVLAGSGCCAGARLTWRHNFAHDGNTNVGHQCLATASIVHESHRRMDGSVSDVCVRCAAGIRARQLCVPLRLVESIKVHFYVDAFVIHLVDCTLKELLIAVHPPDSLLVINFLYYHSFATQKCRPHRFYLRQNEDANKIFRVLLNFRTGADQPHLLYLQTFL